MTILDWTVPPLAAAAVPAGAAVAFLARRRLGRGRPGLAWGAAAARGAAVAAALLAAAGPGTVSREPTEGVVHLAAGAGVTPAAEDRRIAWPDDAPDAARALESLRAALPSDRPGTLALAWSPGTGDPPESGVVAALRPRGADTVVLRPAARAPAPRVPDAPRLLVPPSVVEGVPFTITIDAGNVPFPAGTAVYAIDGHEAALELPAGARRVETPPAEVRAGTHVVAARFPDRPPAVLVLRVAEPPSVLVISSGGTEPPLAARLRKQGLRVAVASDAAADLAGPADVVVLGPGAGRASARDVASRVAAGAGLLVVGGPGDRGLARLRGTALESVLPVTLPEPPAPPPPDETPPPPEPPRSPDRPKPVLDERDREALRVALLLCIDRSGSMAGVKMTMAIESAIAAARALSPEDRIGVLGFDEETTWVAPFQPARDMGALYRRISALRAGGGTNFHPALRIGFAEIAAQPCGIRHVILITDGATRAAVFRDMVESAAEQGITLSTIAVGDGADAHLLGLLAQWGRGRLYPAVDPEHLPQVITVDTKRFVEGPREAAKERLPAEDLPLPATDPATTPDRPTETPPEAPTARPGPAPRAPRVASPAPFLAGIESEEWPVLPHPETVSPRGVTTGPLAWDDGAAALVLGRAGAGRCAVLAADAFSSDARDLWLWIEGARAMAQLVRFLAPPPPPPDASPAVRFQALDEGGAAVVVDAPGGGVLRLRPAGGGDEIRVSCEPDGPVSVGRVVAQPSPGIRIGEFAPAGEVPPSPVACAIAAVPRPDDAELASDLAERSGARLVDSLPGPRPGPPDDRREGRSAPFLVAAALLLVLEAACRRGVRG